MSRRDTFRMKLKFVINEDINSLITNEIIWSWSKQSISLNIIILDVISYEIFDEIEW